MNQHQSLNQKSNPFKVHESFYKENVDLVQFAIQKYNYQIDAKKSTFSQAGHHRWVFLTKENSSDKIIVARHYQKQFDNSDASHFYFKSLTDDECIQIGSGQFKSKGSVIDFIQYEENKKGNKFTMGHCRGVLDRYLSSNPQPSEYILKPFDSPKEINTLVIENMNNILPLKDTEFLNTRGISNDTLFNDKFTQQVFNSTHTVNKQIMHDVFKKVTYTNTSFPIVNENGLIGFDVRNSSSVEGDTKSFKSTIANKYGGIWRSNVNDNVPIKTIFVTESPIDSISYFQLNKNKAESDNTLFLSTCGQPSAAQVRLVEKYLDGTLTSARRAECLVLSYDNAPSGRIFAIQTLASLNPDKVNHNFDFYPDYLKNARFDFSQKDKEDSFKLNFSFDTKSLSEYKAAKNLINSQISLFKSDKLVTQCTFNESKDNSLQGSLTFHKSNDNLDAAFKLIHKIKFNDSKAIATKYSVLKDHNDDLKASLNMDQLLNKSYAKKIDVLQEKIQQPVKKEFTTSDIKRIQEYIEQSKASKIKKKSPKPGMRL